MSDYGRLPERCAGSSARGGRLRCVWLGQDHPGAWPLAAGTSGKKHPACMWLPSPILPACAPQDLAAGPQERVGTDPADGHPSKLPPRPSALSVSQSQCWRHRMRQSPGPEACGHTVPSVRLEPLPSVCLWCLLSVSSVLLGGLPARPEVTHLPGTLTSLFLPPFPLSLLRSSHHLSLPLLAFIFIFFFLFFLCAPSRGAVTEEKGPATWE